MNLSAIAMSEESLWVAHRIRRANGHNRRRAFMQRFFLGPRDRGSIVITCNYPAIVISSLSYFLR